MALTTEQLLQEMRNLDIPPGQKHKKLNYFIRATLDSKAKPEVVIASIPPVDFWSRKLRLDVGEVFQDTKLIIDILKSDEKALINRILTFNWMFKDESMLADPQYLIKDLFPNISRICRQKIIRKLSYQLEDEQKCEQIFEAIETWYGLENAQCLLPACGAEFIGNVLTTRKLQLGNRQLLLILNKFPDLAVSYLKKCFGTKQNKEPTLAWTSHTTSTDFYNGALKFLAGEDCLQFMNIYEEFSETISGLGLSVRAANRLVRFDVDRILAKPRVYRNILYKEFLQKKLTPEQYQSFFSGIYPEVVQHFRRNISDLLPWLSTFTPARKGELLKFGFEKNYSQKLIERIDCIASDIVQFFLPEERMRIVEHKLKQDTSEESEVIDYYESSPKHYESFWAAFRTTNHSIPQIKEFISTEADSSLRSEMIVQLVRTCAINSDKVAFAEVCKYVVTRHRNENVQVHVDFLEAVDQNFNLLELDGSHWDSLRDIIQLCLLTGDITRFSFILNDVLEKAFIYFSKNELPLKTILPALVQMKNDITWGSVWRMETLKKIEYHKYLKSFLQLSAKEIETKFSADDDFFHDPKKTKSILALANCFQEWNQEKARSTTGDKIRFKEFPWLLSRLVELLESDDITDVTSVCQLLMSDPTVGKQTYMDAVLRVNPTERTVLYFLKHDPKKVTEKADHLLKFILRGKLKLFGRLLKSIRVFGPKALSSHMVKVCKATAQDPNGMSWERGNSILVLSNLQPAEEFLKLISQFYPTGSKIEVEGEDVESNLQLVKSSLASLKNIEFPSLGFPTLLQLCTGDYLKYSLGALYSLCLNSSVAKAVPFLNNLVDRPVSVKKHAIRLLCSLSTREKVSAFMLNLWNVEKNATIKQEILKQTFKILSSEALVWEFLKTAISSLSSADKACLIEVSKMENIENVPSGFLSEYFSLCKKVYSQDKVDKTLKICLLQAIGRNKHRLPSKFFQELIAAELFAKDQENQVQHQFILLTISYLLSSAWEVQSSCLDIIANNFLNLRGPNMTTIYYGQSNNQKYRKFTSFFIENLCKLSFDNSYEGRDYSELFRKLLKTEFFNMYKKETFGEILCMEFAIMFHSLAGKGTELEACGARIGEVLDNYVSIYGNEIIGLFSKLLHGFLRQCNNSKSSSTEQILKLISGLIRPRNQTISKSIARYVIASQLFPATCPHGSIEETYKTLATELLKCDEPVVHMYAYNYLKL